MVVMAMVVAGGLGAVCRHLVDVALTRALGDRLPWGIWAVNLAGSFVLGHLVGRGVADDWLLVVGTGWCGGFTTMSTAMIDALALLRRRWWLGLTWLAGMAVTCVGAVVGGVALVR